MKKVFYPIAMSFLILLGIALLAYPLFANWWNMRGFQTTIRQYADSMVGRDEEMAEQQLADARAYNQRIAEIGNRFFPLSEEELVEYNQQLSMLGSSMAVMGYVTIPKINVSLPVYHSTDPSVLMVGLGHLEGSALPVGGPSTHCVLSGHTGMSNAVLLSDLDQMRVGDNFYLHVLNEVRTYEVDKITVVLPNEVEDLMIEDGQDLCTLVTCTPYGVNSHRLLVRGHFIGLRGETVYSESVQSDMRLLSDINVVQYSILVTIPFVLLALAFISRRR